MVRSFSITFIELVMFVITKKLSIDTNYMITNRSAEKEGDLKEYSRFLETQVRREKQRYKVTAK